MKIVIDTDFKKLDKFFEKEQLKPIKVGYKVEHSIANENKKLIAENYIPQSETGVSFKTLIEKINNSPLLNTLDNTNTINISLSGFKPWKEYWDSMTKHDNLHQKESGFSRDEKTVYLNTSLIKEPDYTTYRLGKFLKRETIFNWYASHELGHAISFAEQDSKTGMFSPHIKGSEKLEAFFRPWDKDVTNKYTSIITECYADLYLALVFSEIYPKDSKTIINLISQERALEQDDFYQTQNLLNNINEHISTRGQFKTLQDFNQYATKEIASHVVKIALSDIYAGKDLNLFSDSYRTYNNQPYSTNQSVTKTRSELIAGLKEIAHDFNLDMTELNKMDIQANIRHMREDMLKPTQDRKLNM